MRWSGLGWANWGQDITSSPDPDACGGGARCGAEGPAMGWMGFLKSRFWCLRFTGHWAVFDAPFGRIGGTWLQNLHKVINPGTGPLATGHLVGVHCNAFVSNHQASFSRQLIFLQIAS